jgi:hypothetical protein
MRTLLDEAFPPNCTDEPGFSSPGSAKQLERTFSQNAVLAKVNDLVEVGVGRTVIAAPSVSNDALGRGMAFPSPKSAETEAFSSVSARPASAHCKLPEGVVSL